MTKLQHAEGFWNDLEAAGKVNKELKTLTNRVERVEKLLSRLGDAEVLAELIEEAGDESEEAALLAEIGTLSDGIERLRLETLLKGKYDSLNAILTLHAGAGGTEAQDWCEMLFRMYSRYIERMGWGFAVLDSLVGDEAGFKSITFRAEG
ncbi:MAG: PCRF domain-containing protein, partial [Christensenellales bacterium]